MPLFHPFPSRRWLKESLANAQHELAGARTDVKIMDAHRVRDAKRIAFLEAQVRTQAQTIADLDEEASGLRIRLADREGRLRDYRADKVARGLRWAAISTELVQLREKNANQAELIRNFRSGALQEAVGRYRRAALHRFASTLWASRRRWQERAVNNLEVGRGWGDEL